MAEPDAVLLAYRVTQLEKRQEDHEQAVTQIRDAIISVREDSREIRNRLTAIEATATTDRNRKQQVSTFRWTKLQVWAAVVSMAFVVGFNFYFAAKGH